MIKKYPDKGAAFLDLQGKKLVKIVKAKTPKGPTGKLKKSWRRTKAKEKNEIIKAEVKSTAPHAHLIEYGHKIKNQKNGPVLGFVPGQHMLQTSFDQVNDEWDKELKAWFDDLVKELEI